MFNQIIQSPTQCAGPYTSALSTNFLSKVTQGMGDMRRCQLMTLPACTLLTYRLSKWSFSVQHSLKHMAVASASCKTLSLPPGHSVASFRGVSIHTSQSVSGGRMPNRCHRRLSGLCTAYARKSLRAPAGVLQFTMQSAPPVLTAAPAGAAAGTIAVCSVVPAAAAGAVAPAAGMFSV